MNTSIVSGIIGGAVAVLLCVYLTKKIRTQSNNGALRFGLIIVGLGWICLAFAVFAFSMFFIDANIWRDSSELYSAIGLIVGFGSGAIYLFLEAYGTKGQFNEEGIRFYTPWTGSKNEKWTDLQTIELNPNANWYVLTFRSGAKIRLSSFLGGHGEVLNLLREKGFDF